MALHGAGESATLRLAYDIHNVTVSELIDEDFVPHAGGIIRRGQAELFQKSRRGNSTARLFKVATHRLVDVLQFDRPIFDQSDLHSVITILAARRLLLHDDARPCLDDRHRSDRAIGRKYLRHANFLPDDSVNHCRLPIATWRFEESS